MEELVAEFVAESQEGLVRVEQELIRLEERPEEMDACVGELFRVMHTIKGTCGFLGFARLERLAHAAENVLGAMRDGSLRAAPDVISTLLRATDACRRLVDAIAQDGKEPEGEDRALIEELEACLARPGAAAAEGEPAKAAAQEDRRPVETAETPPAEEGASEPGDPDRPAAATGGLNGDEAKETASGAKQGSDVQPDSDGTSRSRTVRAASLRVSVALLESLMGFVSELVLTRNQLVRLGKDIGRADLDAALQRLDHVTSELREGVMKARMQPISNAWAGLPRLVRETASALGKKVRLITEGGATELDRQMLETIRDPLTHMVRNAVDHGIELPQERRQAGKPEQGTIRLSASQEGGTIVIRLSDDGRGLDVDKIARKAVERGLCDAARIAQMSPRQIYNFIFEPGFSTADQVTSVSGRGVGMDVVRTNVEQIGGSIDIDSVPGEGTTVTINLPLTLAIVPALIVGAAGRRFALPQLAVVEIVRCDDRGERRIEMIDRQPILRLRDQFLPLLSLPRVLGLEEEGRTASGQGFALVLESGGQRFGLLVDHVFDNEEIVVEPMASLLQDLTVLAGTTVLGDGTVAMVLDAKGLAGHVTQAGLRQAKVEEQGAEDAEERITLLRFRAGSQALKAVPLALVARIEQVRHDQLQWADGRSLVLFQGRPMPVVDIDGSPLAALDGVKPVLVFEERGNAFGVLVDEIEDIVETSGELAMSGRTPHVLGAAVIDGVACEILDIVPYVNELFGGWFSDQAKIPTRARRVLVVDDSAFFRALIAPVLEARGLEVTTAPSAEAALELCESGERFDLILSDIEMPGLNGFAFARKLRETAWRDVPLIALSARTSPEDVARGLEAGFRCYLSKLDREALFEAVGRTLEAVA